MLLSEPATCYRQRWTVLILRDLLVEPQRYSDLLTGLPGIPADVLAKRLKELEDDGLVVREARGGSARSIVYRATARAEELRAAFDVSAHWGEARDAGAARQRDPLVDSSSIVYRR